MKIPTPILHLIRRFFPAKRKNIDGPSLAPLLIFLIGFIGTCLFLEFSGKMLFSSPAAFLLLLTAPWFWWLHHNGYHGLGRYRSFAALMIRLVLLGVFVLALAEPRAVRHSDVLSVIYAVDVSDSIGDQSADQALKFVTDTVSTKPEKDEAGLVVFGRNAAVELPPRQTFPYEVVNARITKDGTNLERGLALASAMLPDENPGRIILITDGTETDGRVSTILDSLTARDIPVDVLPISYDYANEVWLEKLVLPQVVKIGETYEASTVLSSLEPGEGKLSLFENGKLIYADQVTYQTGKNRFTVPIYFRAPGYYEYIMQIDLPEGQDGTTKNNMAVSDMYLKGEGKVLLVTDPQGDERDWTLFAQAMKDAGHNVEIMLSYEFPHEALPLLPYDCIVFPNVPSEAFDAVQFQALHDAIYNQGSGFLMIGGRNSFGPGGYNRTLVEKVLPVSMDVKQKKVLPKGALAIVLHTCEFAEGNTWGKRIAKEAIRVLNSQDEAGILIYSWDNQGSGEKWLFPMTPVSDYNKMVPLINNAQIGDMPSFTTTMELGLEGLGASDAAMKHMIIISDGDPSPPPPELLDEFVQDQISISTISINPHGGNDIAIMSQIALQTGGRYYNPKDPSQLPGIFIKEAKTLKRSMIQNKVFIPENSFPSPILKGIDAMPELLGYVITSLKDRANNILVFPDEEEKDPVLSTWRYGLGKTAAFTSDLSPLWAKSWVEWEKYRAFVKQLISDISRVDRQSSLAIQSFADGNKGVILIEDHNADYAHLTVSAEVTLPNRQTAPITIKQTGPAMYQGEFPLQGQGHYQLMVVASGRDDQPEHGVSGFSVPYSPEYLKFRSDPGILKKIAADTNGRILTGAETGEALFNIDRKTKQRSRPIFDWFLFALAILIPLDVGIRRVQLDWLVIKGWLGLNRKRESAETLSTLLKKKEDLGAKFKEQRQGAPTIPKRPPRSASGTKTPKPATKTIPPTPEKDESTADEPTSTTGRLLARKKKWKQEDE